jgi:nicotinamidase-related amidase
MPIGHRPGTPPSLPSRRMPIDLDELVAPAHTALVSCEMQRGMMGDLAGGVDLAVECAELGVVAKAAALAREARRAGVRVVHAVYEQRADGAGTVINTPFLAVRAKRPSTIVQGTPGADIVPELGPEPADIMSRRIHGLTPFTGTDLDQILRNLGIRTIAVVGVSLNEGLVGLCTTAADLGYRIALATDAVAGVPRSFSEQILEHTFKLLATLTTADAIAATWSAA